MVVNDKFARSEEYRKVITAIKSENKCPFCPENFKYHKKPILKKSGEWILTENSFSYKDARFRFLIIGLKHKENFSELTMNDLRSVRYLTNWVIRKFKIRGGAIAVRFGDSNLTGSTVCHLHFHLISPKKKRNGAVKTVNFPIG